MGFAEKKRQGYNQQRAASMGAAVTLVSGAGEFRATFECATRCAEVLGNRDLKDLGDGILDVIPHYSIPTENLYSALGKLTSRFSVALVEYASTDNGGRFVCLWRINPTPSQPPTQGASTNADDY
jgi:hypothetical protein